MTFEIGVLGDVAVHLDGGRVEVGHARQRSVLVALVVDIRRPVPVGALVERVWGADPPKNARSTVYGYLSRLRTVLRAGGAQILRTPGGYQVAVDPQLVDMHHFGGLVVQARRAGTGDEAVERYRKALSLWRGEAFAALDTAWINVQRDIIDGQRLTAQLDMCQILLDRGHPEDVLAELTEAASMHPHHERVHATMMRALDRCGRPADAIEMYHRLRRSLRADLGVEPSPPVADVLARLTTGASDPHPEPARASLPADHFSPRRSRRTTPAPERTTVPLPRQMPARPPRFTGRADDLAALDRMMGGRNGTDPAPVTTITGLGGTGKTWLALEWGHDNLSRFPDGHLFVDLRGFDPVNEPLQPAAALLAFLDAIGVDPSVIPPTPDAMSALYRSLLADRQMLVVLDNARDTAQVVPLLPGAGRSAVLITGRPEFHGLVACHGARSLRLGALDPAESRDVFNALIGPATAVTPDAVAGVVQRCGGLPLALGIVAAQATVRSTVPLHVIAEELRQEHTRLDALATGEPRADLRVVLGCSYRALSPPAARLFRLVATAPGPDAGQAAMASLAAVPRERLRPLLRELVYANLIDERPHGRYSMHDLVRLYGIETVRDEHPTAQNGATRRILDHLAHTATAAATLMDPFLKLRPPPPAAPGVVPEPVAGCGQALAWFRAERPVLLAAITAADAAGLGEHAWHLATTVMNYLSQRGHWDDLTATQRMAMRAARRMDDVSGEAHALRGLAVADIWLGRFATAERYLHRSLTLFERIDDRYGQALVYRGLARASARQGNFGAALCHARRALDRYRADRDEHGIATALNAVGWFSAKLGDHLLGRRFCEQALDAAERIGDGVGIANAHDSLGFVHGHLGDPDRSQAHYNHAIDGYERLGYSAPAAESLVALTSMLRAAGRTKDARQVGRRATQALSTLGHTDADRMIT